MRAEVSKGRGNNSSTQLLTDTIRCITYLPPRNVTATAGGHREHVRANQRDQPERQLVFASSYRESITSSEFTDPNSETDRY